MNIYTNSYRSILNNWCSLESNKRNEIVTKYKVFTVYGFTLKSCQLRFVQVWDQLFYSELYFSGFHEESKKCDGKRKDKQSLHGLQQ